MLTPQGVCRDNCDEVCWDCCRYNNWEWGRCTGAKISQYKKDIAAKSTEIEKKEKELKELEGKL